MSHFEIVRTDQWHVRRVVNGEIVATTETYTRKVAAERAVIAWVTDVLEAVIGPVHVTLEWTNPQNGVRDKTEKSLYVAGKLMNRRVLYVDERGTS